MLCSKVFNPGFAVFSAENIPSCCSMEELWDRGCWMHVRNGAPGEQETLRRPKSKTIHSQSKQPHWQEVHYSIQGCKLFCWCPGSSFCTQQQKEIKAQAHGCYWSTCRLQGSCKVVLHPCCELQMPSKDRQALVRFRERKYFNKCGSQCKVYRAQTETPDL